ncbi:MAG: NADPH-dependent assimilatory sulfite reductase hemoprotein subunit, partial [Ilumatobacteraceae bacterium]
MSVEDVKRSSGFLRGELPEELADGTDAFGADSQVLLKFHGIYQQDDRDVRRERAQKKLGLDYSCMVRASVPGGKLSAEQWLALDRLADLADGSMRLTTRQGVQFHVVHKGELHELVNGINRSLLTTLAACGDVVRNIMGSPWPDERQTVVEPLVDDLVARFRPQTASYWELWVDGEKAVTAQPKPLPFRGPKGRKRSPEPIYGDVYLPRKFKIAVAWPGDNNVDVLANDVGLVPTLTDGLAGLAPSGTVTGYNVYVGGGLGMAHAREDDTYPLLAEPLGWVTPDRVVDVVEAVVTTQRDFGHRDDRHRARLKYLVEERGIEWIRTEVGRRVGFAIAPLAEQAEWVPEEYHGTRDGIIGLPVPSGKVIDRDGVNLRTALRDVIADGTVTQIRITARQDLLLFGIEPDRVTEVEGRLRAHGVPLANDVSALRRLAIACPALPTCGQALGEAERVLPDLVADLEKVLADTGTGDVPIRLNMTGC